MTDTVRIYVVTFRRPQLLERALRSVMAQTHGNWTVEVLNDDPADSRVSEIIGALGDPRIRLSQPSVHRGGTANFNHAFSTVAEAFASILEDDNWWEPGFLSTMVAALARHPEVAIACGNERVWRENKGGSWTDSGRNAWPEAEGEQLLQWGALDKCGGARLCNSSLVFRTAGSEKWRTPESIPIDVTEHFRERLAPHPMLLIHRPLVNYAQTLATNRSSGAVWAGYQVLLVGSVLALARAGCRRPIARALWERARKSDPFLSTTLIATGLVVSPARALWREARLTEKIRFVAGVLRHPMAAASLLRTLERHAQEWEWLQHGAFADFMAQDPTFPDSR